MKKKGIVPCPAGIDIDAKWGYSHTKGWIFGYKLYLTCTTGKIVVPLTAADVTTANVPDNKRYVPLTSSSSSSSYLVFSLPSVLYMIADPGYDDKNLYKYSKKVLG
ncbi:MAG TPA: transposase [Candidatus Nitrosocosmicus sp.]